MPFLIFMIGGSIGLREFTTLRYKYRAVERVNLRDEAKKKEIEVKAPEETVIEKVYEEILKNDVSEWTNVRVPRPEGFE